jgi:uncharacterized protein YbjT (DUF2867 family)
MLSTTGITGKVGGIVANTLLTRGKPVRAVLRDVRKAAAWLDLGCAIASGEGADAKAQETGFRGSKGVFVLLPSNFSPSDDFSVEQAWLANLHRSLVPANREKVVYLSTIGAQATQENLLTKLGIMDRVLGTLPMPVAFLRAAWFLENGVRDVASAKASSVVQSLLQPLDKVFPIVGTSDIGQVAADMPSETWAGTRIVKLEGPRRVSPNEIAAYLGAILKQPIRAEAVPREKCESIFKSQRCGKSHSTHSNARWLQ